LTLVNLEDFDEVVEEANLAEGRPAEGSIRFEQDVLSFVALLKQLSQDLRSVKAILG
jgi:hypothetical protein